MGAAPHLRSTVPASVVMSTDLRSIVLGLFVLVSAGLRSNLGRVVLVLADLRSTVLASAGRRSVGPV